MTDKTIPAFPLEMVYTQENEKFNGMTLRDYFAAKVMQTREWFFYSDAEAIELQLELEAKRCYMVADAMLKARGE